MRDGLQSFVRKWAYYQTLVCVIKKLQCCLPHLFVTKKCEVWVCLQACNQRLSFSILCKLCANRFCISCVGCKLTAHQLCLQYVNSCCYHLLRVAVHINGHFVAVSSTNVNTPRHTCAIKDVICECLNLPHIIKETCPAPAFSISHCLCNYTSSYQLGGGMMVGAVENGSNELRA